MFHSNGKNTDTALVRGLIDSWLDEAGKEKNE